MRETEEGRFVTLMLLRFDPRLRTIECVSAGHPAAYVLDAAGKTKAVLESTAPPLGILPDVAFRRSAPVQLDAGDAVLLMTDGLVEAQSPDGEMFGEQRVREIFAAACRQSPQEIIARLHAAVCEFSGTSELRDDVTAVVLKVK